MKTILITGGSGLLGKPLTRILLRKGYTIHHLSRNENQHGNPKIKIFKWDVFKREIDEKCLVGVDAIIHLAGEGIVEKRWTDNRKKLIIESRTESIRMLYSLLKNRPHQVKDIISASAIGYYSHRGNQLLKEDDLPGSDFLSTSCIKWENAVDEGIKLGLRIVKLRTGIVLTPDGGALPQLAKPIQYNFGAAIGSGMQWTSWIHIQDAISMYVYALENANLNGVYNMVAPNPVTNKTLTSEIAVALNKSLWLPNIPAFTLKLVMGEMSIAILGSTKASAEKIVSAGFKFMYPEIKEALTEIYG